MNEMEKSHVGRLDLLGISICVIYGRKSIYKLFSPLLFYVTFIFLVTLEHISEHMP